mmetsp:Transcript_16069/g.32144  ORF Transcript_16069/g.32144 Transcript_16069/m.32144 type:complete len:206 (+) Transcript_16069:145-762(+)
MSLDRVYVQWTAANQKFLIHHAGSRVDGTKLVFCSIEHSFEFVVLNLARVVSICFVNQPVYVYCELERFDRSSQLLSLNMSRLIRIPSHCYKGINKIAFVVLCRGCLLLRFNNFQELRKLYAAATIIVHLAQHLEHLLIRGILSHCFECFFELPCIDCSTAILVETFKRLLALVNFFLRKHICFKNRRTRTEVFLRTSGLPSTRL